MLNSYAQTVVSVALVLVVTRLCLYHYDRPAHQYRDPLQASLVVNLYRHLGLPSHPSRLHHLTLGEKDKDGDVGIG